MAIYPERTRRRLRSGCLLLAGLGLLSVGFGLAAPSLAPDRPPRAIAPGAAVALPSTGPFGGRLALYGGSTDSSAPGNDRLGCRLRTGDGHSSLLELPGPGAAELDRRVVDGQALSPLSEIRDSAPDWTITCNGPATLAGRPLYLITTAGERDLVPMAAFSFATLALVLGLAGLTAFGPVE